MNLLDQSFYSPDSIPSDFRNFGLFKNVMKVAVWIVSGNSRMGPLTASSWTLCIYWFVILVYASALAKMHLLGWKLVEFFNISYDTFSFLLMHKFCGKLISRLTFVLHFTNIFRELSTKGIGFCNRFSFHIILTTPRHS